MFIIFTNELKIDFLNRKWNSPNEKWNYFSYFQASDQKTSFTKCFSFKPRNSELIFKIVNRILQTGKGFSYPISRILTKKLLLQNKTGNGIIYPTSRPLIKILLLQNVSHSYQAIQNLFSKQEMELFILFPGL